MQPIKPLHTGLISFSPKQLSNVAGTDGTVSYTKMQRTLLNRLFRETKPEVLTSLINCTKQ